MVTNLISNKYTNPPFNQDCIKDRCDQRCRLKDIHPQQYLILDGDEIEKCNCNSSHQADQSCDCIILKDPFHNKVLLVELRSGHKPTSITEAKNKFLTSANEIINTIEEFGESIQSLSFLLLGKVEMSGKKSKKREFYINGRYCFIDISPCGTSIEYMNKFTD